MNSLAEQMALAILRGDRTAAYALADLLLEERGAGGVHAQAAEAVRLRTEHPTAGDGYAVYRWPEFIAFCKRAGILWDLRTVDLTIYVREGQALRIDHSYLGADAPSTNRSLTGGGRMVIPTEVSYTAPAGDTSLDETADGS